MLVYSKLPAMSEDEVLASIDGLPRADGYDLVVVPLRYRSDRPHLSALTDFEDRRITLQIPEPFFPFGEIVHYGAKRLAAKGMRFVWLSEGVTFRTRAEVVRFLYCHEWYHWFLKEILGRASHAETACDRFALASWKRRRVTMADAHAALRRRRE